MKLYVFCISTIFLKSGKSVGFIQLSQSKYGVVFTPKLEGIENKHSNLHGFHVHENASCEAKIKNGVTVLGGAAGGHYDPDKTGKHGFPWTDDNHLGDLPPLFIDNKGQAKQPVLAPRLTLSDLPNRALMIHLGGDNHSDEPSPLGGGGPRLVCGVIGAKPISKPGACEGVNVYPKWTAKDWEGGKPNHANSGDKMVFQGALYRANWYTNSIPGSDISWTLLELCGV